MTGLGLAVSIAGNVGHVGGGDWTTRLTAGVPPTAAAEVPSTVPVRAKAPAGRVPVRAKASAAPVAVDPVTAAVPGARSPSRHSRQRGKVKGRRQLTRLSHAEQETAVLARSRRTRT